MVNIPHHQQWLESKCTSSLDSSLILLDLDLSESRKTDLDLTDVDLNIYDLESKSRLLINLEFAETIGKTELVEK